MNDNGKLSILLQWQKGWWHGGKWGEGGEMLKSLEYVLSPIKKSL